jgi:acetyltransferase-like isoleucine patch superfamily enzyme
MTNPVSVVIDGVTYIPRHDIVAYDCDGRELKIGDRVYVRQSRLSDFEFAGMNHSNRNGRFVKGAGNAEEGDDVSLGVEFDSPMNGFHDLGGVTFPASGYWVVTSAIRRNPNQ